MDPNKLRYAVCACAIVAGTILVITGHLTGEQWANTVGGLLTGSGAATAVQSRTP